MTLVWGVACGAASMVPTAMVFSAGAIDEFSKKAGPGFSHRLTVARGKRCSAHAAPPVRGLQTGGFGRPRKPPSHRQQHGVDHMDDAVRLQHVGDSNGSDVALGVGDRELAGTRLLDPDV